MKKLTVLCGVLLASFWGACVADVPGAMTMKIGTIDMQEIFASPNGVEKIQKDLEKQFSGERAEVMQLMKQLQADQKALEKNSAVMSKGDLTKKESEIKSEQEKFETAQTKYQQSIMAAQSNAMKEFVETIKKSTRIVAVKNKLDAVFVKNTLMYAKDSQDVTPDVLKEMAK